MFLQQRIKEQIPTSLIRLGDGEAAVGGYPELTNRIHVDRSWKIWFGDTSVSDTQIEQLSLSLRAAISDADVVGIPRKNQINKFHLYGTVTELITQFKLLNKTQVITDAAIHRYLQFALLYRPILRNLEFLGIISSRHIGRKLKEEFGIKQVVHYPVRGEFLHPGSENTRHFPDGFDKLHDTLSVPYKGAIFLVGAGVFGKIYCQWIKELGGIAIDIGSLFDSWAKVDSRTRHRCHHLEVYKENERISAERAIERYNSLCDEFELDTPRASINSDVYSKLPNYW